MIILTQDELRALTGRSRPTAQARWLKANDFLFVMGADGHPKVDRTAYMQRMQPVKTRFTQPHFERIR